MPEMKVAVHGIEEALDELDRVKVNVEKVLLPELKAHAVSVCNDLMSQTPPLLNGGKGSGGTPQAVASGRAMVEKQIKSIFKPTQSMLFGHLVMARDFQACANYNWTPTSEGMIKDINNQNWKSVYERFQRNGWKRSGDQIVDRPTKALHNAARGTDGKTRKTYYVRQKEAITQYIAQVQATVGAMVSGWVDARQQIGSRPADGKNVNAVRGSGTGFAVVQRGGKGSFVRIVNKLGDLHGVLSKTNILSQVLSKRRLLLAQGIKKRVDEAVRNEVKKTKTPKIR